jgi:hypothetical protein
MGSGKWKIASVIYDFRSSSYMEIYAPLLQVFFDTQHSQENERKMEKRKSGFEVLPDFPISPLKIISNANDE